MKYFIVTDGKETQVVQSLNGYENWAVEAECDQLPKTNEKWDKKAKKWQLDEKLDKAHKRENKARDNLHLLDRIEALEEKLSSLQEQLNAK